MANFTVVAQNPLYRTPEFAYNNAAVCALNSQNPLTAERFAGMALQQKPNFSDAILTLAEAKLALGENQVALGLLNQFHRRSQHASVDSLRLAAKAAMAAGDVGAAQAYHSAWQRRQATINE